MDRQVCRAGQVLGLRHGAEDGLNDGHLRRKLGCQQAQAGELIPQVAVVGVERLQASSQSSARWMTRRV